MPLPIGVPNINGNHSFFAPFEDHNWHYFSSSVYLLLLPLLYDWKGRGHIIPTPSTTSGTHFALSDDEVVRNHWILDTAINKI